MQKHSFSVGGGSKKFQDWGGGIKNLRNGWGVTFAEKRGVSTPLHGMAFSGKS